MKLIKISAGVLLAVTLTSWACSRGATVASVSSKQGPQASGDLHYKVPDGWVIGQPSSKMRVAQFKLPKADGDNEDAELVLYYFGANQGGTAEANIDRWISQIQQADGSSSKEKAKTESLTVNGLKITTVDVSGRYTAEMAPGSGKFYDNASYRLRAAVIETAKGNYFLKLVGPAKTVGRWDQSFTDFVKSFEFNSVSEPGAAATGS
jgi:hypothetical protein